MKKLLGMCGVDSGMLMVGDPCYFIGEEASIREKCETWQQACREVFAPDGGCPSRDTPMNVYGLGVAIGTTHGDGVYSVSLETVDGRRRLIVELG